MFKFIGVWWRERQRTVDLEVLWPICKEQAPDIKLARSAFFMHCTEDTAWTKDYSVDEIAQYVDALT
jgi:hypothetical protein